MAGVEGAVFVRTLVLRGEDHETAAARGKKLVAKSECRFQCASAEALKRCIEQLRESDEHLRNRPEEMMLWNWIDTYVERPATGSDDGGGAVVLGVAWYDDVFFESNRDAYLNVSHLEKYLQIGLDPGSVEVVHWRFVGEGRT